jgi:hypothetical protein
MSPFRLASGQSVSRSRTGVKNTFSLSPRVTTISPTRVRIAVHLDTQLHLARDTARPRRSTRSAGRRKIWESSSLPRLKCARCIKSLVVVRAKRRTRSQRATLEDLAVITTMMTWAIEASPPRKLRKAEYILGQTRILNMYNRRYVYQCTQ